MPIVHTVKKARKTYRGTGIKKGDKYYWWKFRYGSKIKSKVYPKPSQLTQSEFLSTIYELTDRIEAFSDGLNRADVISEIEDIASEIRSLGEEQEDKRSNMPDQLQDAPSGELLEQRAEECSTMADSLESIDTGADLDEIVGEAQSVTYEGE